MEKLTNWKARRSGGRITILATDDTSTPSKVPNIDTIERQPGGEVIATDKSGKQFLLA